MESNDLEIEKTLGNDAALSEISTVVAHPIVHGRESRVLFRSEWILQSNAHSRVDRRSHYFYLWRQPVFQPMNRRNLPTSRLFFFHMLTRFVFSTDICGSYGNSTYMCPRCDKACPFWKLSDSCFYTQVSRRVWSFSIQHRCNSDVFRLR